MAEKLQLNHPWLIAIWPGMGNVALNAGIYLLSKLGMTEIGEYEASGLFDVDYVEVKNGLIKLGRRPRNRFFLWNDPQKARDLVVFLGEAQPPIGKYMFCKKLIEYAQELQVERVFTFAAMATDMHPSQRSRLFGAATDAKSLEELKRLEVTLLESGHIGGLNGILLGAAAESGLTGTCLLGEMPQVFSQIAYPKASLAILEVFTTLTRLALDLGELAEQAKLVDEQLEKFLAQVEKAQGPQYTTEEEPAPEPVQEDELKSEDEQRIERLFEDASKDRSKAFELKQELDRLGVFKDYEDRFLDLFKKTD